MSEEDTTQESTQTEDTTAQEEQVTPVGWSYADGVEGQGDAPDWFKGDKYNTVADQAKAYKDLESSSGRSLVLLKSTRLTYLTNSRNMALKSMKTIPSWRR